MNTKRNVNPDIKRFQEEKNTSALIEALQREEEMEAKIDIVKAIGSLRDPAALETLVKTFIEDMSLVRDACSKVISKFGFKVVEMVLVVLNDKKYRAANEYSLYPLPELMRRSGGKRSVKALISLLTDPYMRPHAAMELAKIGDPLAVEPLIEAVITNGYLDEHVVNALEAIPDTRSILSLISAYSVSQKTDSESCSASMHREGLIAALNTIAGDKERFMALKEQERQAACEGIINLFNLAETRYAKERINDLVTKILSFTDVDSSTRFKMKSINNQFERLQHS